MIPYEDTCNVLLLGCLGLSTLDLTKEFIRHSTAKSRKPMIWCNAVGDLFRPPYVCGQCHKTVYLRCMHCEGCGFCLHTLECPVRGRAHPNTDKWLFQKWCQEVDVEEVFTATLPNEPVSGDEELDLLSNPLLDSPPDKEVKKKAVQSSDLEVDLFAPPSTAKAKAKKALPSAPPVDPPTSQRGTRSTIPSETTPLVVGDWLTDKDIVCCLNQEVCHNEIDEPRAWSLALLYIKRLSKYMQRVESGEKMANMRWCRLHIFVFNSDDKGRVAMVCLCLRLSCPVGAFHYLGLGTPKLHSFDPSFLVGLEEVIANHQAPRLGIPNGRLVLWFSKLEHREAGGRAPGYFFRWAPCPNGCRFCGLCAQHC